MIPNARGRRHQSGAALLLMMLVVVIGAASILVTKLNRNAGRTLQAVATQTALGEAKDALLAYALSYPDTHPGSAVQLPCPDLNASGATLDGESHTLNCGGAGVTMLGRLPWKTLGIAAPQDGGAECLWYVVSGDHKSADTATAAMINADSNGQLQLLQSESGIIIEGQTPENRPVALIIAAGPPVGNQSRQALSQPGQQCSDDYSIPSFLDVDTGSGVSNAVTIDTVGIDQFVRAAGVVDGFNDRIASISRKELADLTYARHDFQTNMQTLTNLITECVAAYGSSNPAGPTDLRLPWPAPVAMTDYRSDNEFDDVVGGVLSGRLANVVGDSSAITGNSIAQVLVACDPVQVPGWNATQLDLWRQWKDHFFYYVAESFAPVAAVPSICASCLTVNGGGQFAAVVLFANRRLAGLGQVRNAPPIDADTRNDILNYLETTNSSSHPYSSGVVDLESRAADSSFNDVLYCIDATMTVTGC